MALGRASGIRRNVARSGAVALAALVAAVVAGACGGDDPCDSLTGPAVVTSVEVTGPDGAIPIGATAQFRAVPKSACGAAVEGATVSWSSTDPRVATVSATGVVTGVGQGQASIQASSEGQMGTTPVMVERTAGPGVSLHFTVQPGDAEAGATLLPVAVEVRDAFGIVVDTWGEEVELGLIAAPEGAALKGDTTRDPTDGTATFDGLSIEVAGSGYRLRATSPGLTAAESEPFAISPGPVANLSFAVQPATTAAGSVLAPPVVVGLRDAFGNQAAGTSPVSLSLVNANGAELLGTTTVPASGGAATFANLRIEKAGTGYRLRASAAGQEATSAAFTVTPGPRHALGFSVQPPVRVRDDRFFDVEVSVYDAYGNLVPSSLDVVSLQFGNKPNSNAFLGGTLVRTTSQGRAAFPNLFITRDGDGYTLVASSPGLVSAESEPIEVF